MKRVTPRFKATGPRHFIRKWRHHRGYTQEQLAEMLGITHGTLSQLERGQINYTQPMLEALAEALRCEPADLIVRDPDRPEAPWSILDSLKPEAREQAINYIRFLKQAQEQNEDAA